MGEAKTLVGKPSLAREMCVVPRTIDRWVEDKTLGFPRPIKIRTRVYFVRDELEMWKRDQLLKSTNTD
jgi:predicted DNA-binding transcriptional regulator AlpA